MAADPEELQSLQEMLDKKVSLKEYLEQCEEAYLSLALKKYKTTYKAADALQTSQTSIVRKKHKYKLCSSH